MNKFLVMGILVSVIISIFGVTSVHAFYSSVSSQPDYAWYPEIPIPPYYPFPPWRTVPEPITAWRFSVAEVNITEPDPDSVIWEGNLFTVTAKITCKYGPCPRLAAEISLPGGLFLPNNDLIHELGSLGKNEFIFTSWEVFADSTGNYIINVSSYIKGLFSHSDLVNIVVEKPTANICKLSVDIISPIPGTNFSLGDNFSTIATIENIGNNTCFSVSASVLYNKDVLNLTNDDPVHAIGSLLPSQESTETWDFETIALGLSYTNVSAKDESGAYGENYTWVWVK